MESIIVVPGDSMRMASIVGSRKNLHHSGTTSGTSLMECQKSTLKDVPQPPTSDKREMMGAARVKDDSRASHHAKGPLSALCHDPWMDKGWTWKVVKQHIHLFFSLLPCLKAWTSQAWNRWIGAFGARARLRRYFTASVQRRWSLQRPPAPPS